MCGIVGLAGPHATEIARTWIAAALEGLRHRGPDAQAIAWLDGAVLGHARLSIVDLSPAGAQPMTSASGNSVIAYNGEVYNTTELRSKLGSLPLRGHSDTELVLERLEREGPAALPDLNGMFALALWQRDKRRLVLARDRTGIKPLYVAQLPGVVAFCSEVRPLMTLPGLDRRIDPEALQLYLALGMVPAPFTLWRGIRQLTPGEVWTVDAQTQVVRSRLAEPIGAWHPQQPPSDPEQLPALLQACVADQLVADVPVGVLLSGGVDSSLVAAAAARAVGKVRTFSVVHADPRYDERKAARAVADHIGSEHVELELPAGGLTEAELDALVDHYGDPFADSSALPTRRLAAMVRRHVTVALSGDGGDELFAGYTRYRENGWVTTAARLGSHASAAIGATATRLNRHVGAGDNLRGKLRRGARLFDLARRPPTQRAVGTLTYFWPDESRALLRPEFRCPQDALSAVVSERAVAGLDPTLVEGCHRLEQRLVLPDDMLVKVDRMTMAESLEIRPPLLDNRMVAFAQALPLRHKFDRGVGKIALKALARQWVPAWVVDRPKQGFALPLLAFGGAVLQDRTRWALGASDSPLRELFEPAALAQLSEEFARRGEGWQPEDSPFRRAHRQWALVLLATALQRRGWLR